MQRPNTLNVAMASVVGTAIEFYDFYIYAMAAALVIGPAFFPASAPETQSLNAFLTFGLAFIARPLGALLFGHWGDKIGRKSTLAASLSLMGVATVLIGLLPDYASLGFWAPLILCFLRFLQGIGLGGEWAGAALIATEYAPVNQKHWFGMFPQLGPAIGFIFATLSFLGLSFWLDDAAFQAWGWRIPFILSAILVVVGLYVRWRLSETPEFLKTVAKQTTHYLPMKTVYLHHKRSVVTGALAMVVCYQLFYLATVFCLNYGTTQLGIPRTDFLWMLCIAVVMMLIATPISAALADQWGSRKVLLICTMLSVIFGFSLPILMQTGQWIHVTLFLSLALFLMGLTFAPMGAFLPSFFPVEVRYTGAGLAYQLGGILGASFAPAASQWLVTHGGLEWVALYVSGMAFLSFLAVLLSANRE